MKSTDDISIDEDQAAGLFAEHKEEIPESWHRTFDKLTAKGHSPSCIKATIEYMTSDITQDEVARKHGCSTPSIRSLTSLVIEYGPMSAREAMEVSGGLRTGEYCEVIAETLGWEEGEEYNIPTGPGNQQPNLRKKGWIHLFQVLSEEQSEGFEHHD